MKKKFLSGLLVVCLAVAIFLGGQAAANSNLFLGQFPITKIEINGKTLEEGDIPSFIVNSRTVIPLSQVSELLNVYVTWNGTRRVVEMTKPIVNMSIIYRNSRNHIEVNPTFTPGTAHSFMVANSISRLPAAEEMTFKFVLTDIDNKNKVLDREVRVDTSKFNGGFQGNLDVVIRFPSEGDYILKLLMEDPKQKERFITIGESIIYVRN